MIAKLYSLILITRYNLEYYYTVPLILQQVWLDGITLVVHAQTRRINAKLVNQHIVNGLCTAL